MAVGKYVVNSGWSDLFLTQFCTGSSGQTGAFSGEFGPVPLSFFSLRNTDMDWVEGA
jgi:hypothetical protein